MSNKRDVAFPMDRFPDREPKSKPTPPPTTTGAERHEFVGPNPYEARPPEICACGQHYDAEIHQTTAAQAAAREIADALLTTGSGRKGDHLQIVEGTPPNSIYLAGWCEQAIADYVARIISKHLSAGEVEAAIPLCPVHRSLEDRGKLEVGVGNDCIACSLNERQELLDLLAPFAAPDASEDTVTVLRRLADFYDTHQGEGRVVVSYPAGGPAAEPSSSAQAGFKETCADGHPPIAFNTPEGAYYESGCPMCERDRFIKSLKCWASTVGETCIDPSACGNRGCQRYADEESGELPAGPQENQEDGK